MRIQPHTAVGFEPNRSAPVTRQPISSSFASSATKPASRLATQIPSSDPFSTLFQSLTSETEGSSTSTGVSATSIVNTSASVTPAAAATTTSAATTAAASTAQTATTEATTGATSTAAAAVTADAAATVQTPGIQALVTNIMNGSFQPTYVTNPSQLTETTSFGTDTMPNVYYASDATASQLASMLGGKVVQLPPFGQDQGSTEPLANFIQLPNGQTFNAADIAYYANCGSEGPAQLTADLTASINEGSAWTSYYANGGQMPTFSEGYVGPPISGMTYPSGMIGANGNVINPATQGINT